jgi:hypothetical protein
MTEPDVLAINAGRIRIFHTGKRWNRYLFDLASASLATSDIPWDGPIGRISDSI